MKITQIAYFFNEIILQSNIISLKNITLYYLHTKDPSQEKYQYLINIRESTGLKHFNDLKTKWYVICLQKHWWIQYQ